MYHFFCVFYGTILMHICFKTMKHTKNDKFPVYYNNQLHSFALERLNILQRVGVYIYYLALIMHSAAWRSIIQSIYMYIQPGYTLGPISKIVSLFEYSHALLI